VAVFSTARSSAELICYGIIHTMYALSTGMLSGPGLQHLVQLAAVHLAPTTKTKLLHTFGLSWLSNRS